MLVQSGQQKVGLNPLICSFEDVMSAIDFFLMGGMANLDGDLPGNERALADNMVKSFGKYVRQQVLARRLSASIAHVLQCNYLIVARDNFQIHFVFASAPGGTKVQYRDFRQQGLIELQRLADEIRIQVGDVAWAFAVSPTLTPDQIETTATGLAQQYLEAVVQAMTSSAGKIQDEAVAAPEISPGLQRFRADHPRDQKTAFVMMQFGTTQLHDSALSCIKRVMAGRGITALRADDKEYMDDLFLNIRTYMHACDFGVAVIERITGDDFNPNVSLEVGYMMGLGKRVLLLKDLTLKSLQSDLVGKLYKPFNTLDIEATMPNQIEKWLVDNGFAKP